MTFILKIPDVVHADLLSAIHSGDMHFALHCAAILVMEHPQDAEEILQEAAGIAGGLHHSPRLVTPDIDRLEMVKRGLMADLEAVFEKRQEAFQVLESIDVIRNEDGQLEAVPFWSE